MIDHVGLILLGLFLGTLGIFVLYPGIRLLFYAIFRSFFQAKEAFEKREDKKNNNNKKEAKNG